MAYDKNWPRWFKASVATYLKGVADSCNFVSLVEGLEERTTTFQESLQRLEIRINGPDSVELSQDYWRFRVTVQILIISHMDGTLDDVYNYTKTAGVMAEALANPIPILKKGTGIDDDQSQLGCLKLQPGNTESLTVSDFGEVNTVNRIREAAVFANLEMFLCI